MKADQNGVFYVEQEISVEDFLKTLWISSCWFFTTDPTVICALSRNNPLYHNIYLTLQIALVLAFQHSDTKTNYSLKHAHFWMPILDESLAQHTGRTVIFYVFSSF